MEKALIQKPDHRNALRLSAAIAFHQRDLNAAVSHLNSLLNLPPERQVSLEQWVDDLPFPVGALVVADQMKIRNDIPAALEFLEFAAEQARRVKNPEWVQAIEAKQRQFLK